MMGHYLSKAIYGPILLKIKKFDGSSVGAFKFYELLVRTLFLGAIDSGADCGPSDGFGTATSVVLDCKAQHISLASDIASVV